MAVNTTDGLGFTHNITITYRLLEAKFALFLPREQVINRSVLANIRYYIFLRLFIYNILGL